MAAELSELERDLVGIIIRLNAEGKEAYGVPINDELTIFRGGREIAAGTLGSLAALYATLQGLVDKGLLTATPGEATEERGGRAKRLYWVTENGRKAYGV